MHALRRVGLAGTALARACANQREFIAAFNALGAAAR